jgi:cytoskeletal protein RodZ
MKDDHVTLSLSTIRTNRGISLQQIADSTKISIRSLEAIEQCDFAKLPGGIYNTSYIKQYARAIDYDEAEILAVYHTRMKGSSPTANGSGDDRKPGPFGTFRPSPGTL